MCPPGPLPDGDRAAAVSPAARCPSAAGHERGKAGQVNVLGIIATGVAALFITVVLAKVVRRAALRPHPARDPAGRGPRTRTLRTLVGASAVLGVGAAAGAARWLGAAGESADAVTGMLAGGAIVAALGLVHALRPLPSVLCVAVQAAAATLAVCLAGLSPAAGVLAVLWIVLVTGAFAVLDDSEGVLAAVGIVTAAGLIACAALDGGLGLALLPAALTAGLVGLLTHHRHPTRVRLGASGALFTGFVLASSGALIHVAAPSGRTAWAALPVLATVALADAALVLISRRRAARSLLRGADDHIAHRLRRIRVTVPGTAVLLALWAAVPVLAGTLVYAKLLHPALLLVPLAGTAAAVFGLLRIPAYTPPPRTAARRTATGHATGAGVPSAAPVAGGPAGTAATAPGGTGPARTAAGHPTVPSPPSGRSTAHVAAERS